MSLHQTCNPALLQKLLDHQITDDELVAIEEHLNNCSVCRKGLENLAAAPEFWMGLGGKLKTPLEHDTSDRPRRNTSEETKRQALVKTLVTKRVEKGVVENGSQNSTSPAIHNHLKHWLADSDDPNSLGQLGPYAIDGMVGVGGMSVVLKGYDKTLNRFVAIKVLATHLAANETARHRFTREAQAAAAVVHENVLAIHSIGESMELPYLVMPFVSGESLEARLNREIRLDVEDILRIGQQIASGLAAAHEQGLVHRDVKPGNVLLEENSDNLKIADFGLARAADDASLTHSGSITGTPLYMSPEQARGENVEQRSDQFSFGSLLYVLATGRPPFQAETPYGIIRRICDATPQPIQELNSEVPNWLEAIIEKMMSKKASERFSDCNELAVLFAEGLAHFRKPGSVPLSPVLQRYVTRTHKIGLGLKIGVIGSVACLLGVVAWQSWFGPSPENQKANGNSSDEVAQMIDEDASENSGPQEHQVNDQDTNAAQESESSTEREEAGSTAAIERMAYQFKQGQELIYDCDLKIIQNDYRIEITGLVKLKVEELLAGSAIISYELMLHGETRRDEQIATIPRIWNYRPNELDEFVARCRPKGKFEIDFKGRITNNTSECQLPGEMGSLMALVFPPVSSSSEQSWACETVVEGTVYKHVDDRYGMSSMHRAPRIHTPAISSLHGMNPFDPFNDSSESESVVFVRDWEFASDRGQAFSDRLKMVNVSGTDTPSRSSRLTGLANREISGWFQFDSRLGQMVKTSLRRKVVGRSAKSFAIRGTSFKDPDVLLQLTLLTPEEAAAKEKE